MGSHYRTTDLQSSFYIVYDTHISFPMQRMDQIICKLQMLLVDLPGQRTGNVSFYVRLRGHVSVIAQRNSCDEPSYSVVQPVWDIN